MGSNIGRVIRLGRGCELRFREGIARFLGW